MQSTSAARKAPKGSVQVISSNNRLQIRFRYGGKRHYLSTGLPDTKVARKAAEGKARQIELDIISGNFDPSLAKYKPQSALSTVAPDITPSVTPEVALRELWDSFIEFKRPQCSENTMKFTYGVYTNYINKLPTYDLSQAPRIRDQVLKTIPLNSAKRFITRLSACCKLAMQSVPLAKTPLRGWPPQSSSLRQRVMMGLPRLTPFLWRSVMPFWWH
jgi:hypothetical protein